MRASVLSSKGRIGDIDWYRFVHEKFNSALKARPRSGRQGGARSAPGRSPHLDAVLGVLRSTSQLVHRAARVNRGRMDAHFPAAGWALPTPFPLSLASLP